MLNEGKFVFRSCQRKKGKTGKKEGKTEKSRRSQRGRLLIKRVRVGHWTNCRAHMYVHLLGSISGCHLIKVIHLQAIFLYFVSPF